MLDLLLRLTPLYALAAFLRAKRVLVDGWSMHPALAPGERLLVDTLAYRREPPRRGEVVLARDPREASRRILKRVAGIPGDDVTLGGESRRLGDGEYFLLGDSPEASTDGRHFGPVAASAIEGRAWVVYWPPGRRRRVEGR